MLVLSSECGDCVTFEVRKVAQCHPVGPEPGSLSAHPSLFTLFMSVSNSLIFFLNLLLRLLEPSLGLFPAVRLPLAESLSLVASHDVYNPIIKIIYLTSV